ncbi:MAG: hypothetical protein ACRC0L_02540, partial [Angustibacter sp.]
MRDLIAATGHVADRSRRCESLLLYLRSDLRAQGIITPGHLRRGFLLSAAAATAAGSFQQVSQLVSDPGPSPWQYAALTVGCAAIYGANGLTVGRETLSSAREHQRFLASRPISRWWATGILAILIAARISAVSIFLIMPGFVAGLMHRPNLGGGLAAALGLLLWPGVPGALAARWVGHASPAALGLIFLGASGTLLTVFATRPGAEPFAMDGLESLWWLLGSPARLILGAGSWIDLLLAIFTLAGILALGVLRPAHRAPRSLPHPARWALPRIGQRRLATGFLLHLAG